ncbi:MAG: hypothetical protein LBC75_01140 [Fibromonadaceae bacterium]|nr:hypothetical protein [Fibromonadaceae bacterium]
MIPSAENFYDLFGGGGSIVEAACRFQENGLFEQGQKWKHIHYNELNTGVYLLNKAIWEGTFDFDKARRTWISRERFFAEKDEPTAWGAFVRFCWSFGGGGDMYIYGKEIENTRNLQHLLTLMDWVPGETQNEKRLFLRKEIGKVLKNHKQLQSLQRLERLQSLERLERLESLEGLQRLESLERLERVNKTNKDYRDVPIEPNSVVYCDIPYEGSGKCYGVNFDFAGFYEWSKTREFPVYHSGYMCSDPFFKLTWEKVTQCRMSKKDGKGIYKTEKLFWNGRKL